MFAHLLRAWRQQAPSDEKPIEEEYPGLPLAYDSIYHAYEWPMRRLDAIEDRIRAILTWTATVSVGVPTLAHATGVADWRSPLFIAAMLLFLAIGLIGLTAYWFESIQVVDPGVLFEKWRRLPEPQFRSDLLYFAGQAFQRNRALVERNANKARLLSALFMLEALLLAFWALTTR